MTVKEFFQTLDIDEFVNYYLFYEYMCGNREFDFSNTENLEKYLSAKLSIKKAFEKLLTIEPIIDEERPIVFSMNTYDSYALDSFVIHHNDLMKKQVGNFDTYAYEFCEMNKILGFSISDACRRYIDNDLHYAASIFYEMTFFGYDCDKHDKEVNEKTEELNQQVEEIQSGQVETIPAEEVFKEFNFTDNRKSFEKSFDKNTAKANYTHKSRILKLLCDLEKRYIIINENS